LVIASDLDTYAKSPTEKEGDSVRLENGDGWCSDPIEKYIVSLHTAVNVDKSDTALILFSGGTTGIPKGIDQRQVEAVKAWVVLKTGKQTTPDNLQQFCREKLTGYKVPRFFEFRKELPKTMVGKVLRRILQDKEKAK
jgi:acyl-CoA synthetase (AMP-forming)/AMP-acid ligase II